MDDLVGEFRVHRRLITQAVVTLIQDGFVALGGAGGQALLSTREGEEAVGRGRLSRTVVGSPRRTTVVMERLTGALAPNTEVRFDGDRDVRELYPDAQKLPIRVAYNDLDGAQVRHLLARPQGEWIQHIGPIVQLSKGTHWLAVDVDVQADTVIGMPERWGRRLKPVIFQTLRELGVETRARDEDQPKLRPQPRQQRTEEDETDGPTLEPDQWSIRVGDSDVVASTADLRAATSDALADPANHSVLIAVAAVDEQGVDAVGDDIAAALRRGAQVDVLWGRDAGGGLDRLKKLRYDVRDAGALDFNYAACPTGIEATVAAGEEHAHILVGGGGRLSAAAEEGWTIAVRVDHPVIISAILLAAVGAWRAGPDERLAAAPDRLARLAADLAARTPVAAEAPNAIVRVVLDRDHEIFIADALRNATRAVTLVSARPTEAAPARLLGLLSAHHDEHFLPRALIGQQPPLDLANQLTALIAAEGGGVEVRPGSGSALLADETALVGSYDPLGTQSYGTGRGVRHVSLSLTGDVLANLELAVT